MARLSNRTSYTTRETVCALKGHDWKTKNKKYNATDQVSVKCNRCKLKKATSVWDAMLLVPKLRFSYTNFIQPLKATINGFPIDSPIRISYMGLDHEIHEYKNIQATDKALKDRLQD